MVRPGCQVTPIAPYPVTGSGRLVTWLAPSDRITERAWSRPGAIRAPAGAVNEYSSTFASTASVGTFDGSIAAWAYSAIGAAGPSVRPTRRSGTTSSEITPAAGVSTARTTPSASNCWQTVTKRAW
jgi:hypothetical protein